jgi:hypothetical protein
MPKRVRVPGSATTRGVPSLPFLPASTVSSAAELVASNEVLGTLQVCCTLQPTMGFAMFRAFAPAPAVQSEDHLAWVGPEAFPDGVPPFEAFPSPVAYRSSVRASSRRSAFTDQRAFSSLVPAPSCCVATAFPRRFLDLKALFHRRVRSTLETLPSEGARCFPGLLANTLFSHLAVQGARIRIHVKERVRRLPSR